MREQFRQKRWVRLLLIVTLLIGFIVISIDALELIVPSKPQPPTVSSSSKGIFPHFLIEGEYYYIHKVEEGEFNNSIYPSVFLGGQEYVLLGKVED